jgi:membrane-associated phospholipid phosphatase
MTRKLCVIWAMVIACQPLVAAADLVTEWNATMRDVLQQDGTHPVNKANPGWSTRSFAMVNGAIYDAFQATNRTHQPFMVDTRALPNTSLDAAVHQAAYELLLHCYPGEQSMLDAAYQSRMATIPNGLEKTNGMDLGHSIAHAYKLNRTGDHAEESFPYTAGTEPGQWRPDPYNPNQVAWGPGWGTVQPFAIPNTDDFIAALPPIPDLQSQAYTDAFNMVKDYGAMNSPLRTTDQTEMGLFWAYDRPTMGPPIVLFTNSLEQIADAAGNTPDENARLFAMASVATADAATAAWDAKFEYNFWRPVAAIQEADTDENPDTVADPTWRPLGAPGADPNGTSDDFTPPFPSWTSGHATMGGAWFKSIELFYGTNVFDEIDGIIGNDPVYTLTSQENGSGSSRDFTTFTQNGPLGVGLENSPEGENGMSRIYLGVHWIFDQEDGITMGNDIAHFVAANHFLAVPEPSTILLGLTAVALCMAGMLRRRK